MGAEVFTNIAARRNVKQLDAKAQAAWNNNHLLRLDINLAQFRRNAQPSLLRNNQQFTVGIIKKTINHGTVCGVQMNSATGLRSRIAVTSHGDKAIDEIRRHAWQGRGIPTQLIW